MALSRRAQQSGDPNLVGLANHKLGHFQKGFVSQGGLPDRPFFQHVVMAPGLDLGYDAVTFPGVTEAVEAGNFTRAREWVGKTAAGVRRAAEILKV